jgi:Flp pilus assembly protein TadG
MMMKHKTRQQGSLVVELALVILLLVPLTFGVTEYGRAIYQYNAIAKGVRDGVRYLSQQAAGNADDQKTKAACLVVYGKADCSGTALVPGLTTGMVTVRDSLSDPITCKLQSTGRGALNLVTVEVHDFAFTSIVPLYVSHLKFAAISATMVQIL